METLDFSKDEKAIKLKLKVNGEVNEYVVKMPKWKDSKELSKNLKDANKDAEKELEVTENYLISLGLPKEALEELTGDQMTTLSNKLGAATAKK